MRFTLLLAVASAALVAGAPIDNKDPKFTPGSLPPHQPHFPPNGTFAPYPNDSDCSTSGSIPPPGASDLPPPPTGTLNPTFSLPLPTVNPISPALSPSSPAFSLPLPTVNPSSPALSPSSPALSPSSPALSPSSPALSPSSPALSPSPTPDSN